MKTPLFCINNVTARGNCAYFSFIETVQCEYMTTHTCKKPTNVCLSVCLSNALLNWSICTTKTLYLGKGMLYSSNNNLKKTIKSTTQAAPCLEWAIDTRYIMVYAIKSELVIILYLLK